MATTGGNPRGTTVRARILVLVLALTGLTLLVAGGTAFVLQRDRVDDVVDASLHRTAEEFSAFADDAARTAGADAREIIYDGMVREVPGPGEGMVGFVDGRLEYTMPSGLPLADDAELVTHLTDQLEAASGSGSGRIASVTTAAAEYRYALIPVTVDDVGVGALVVAFDRAAEQASVTDTFRTYALVSAVSFAVLAVVGWLLSGRLLRPVRQLRETAETISETDLSRRIDVTGTDDLSDLARTFNAMLARLEDAFSSQRRLLDDAGHELRTPITIVRGHLELMDPADPADTAATKALALSELDRMHRLADDLVMLARSEQPDFVQPAPASLGLLIDNVLDQARPLGERRWRVDERLEAEASVDAQRLTQAMLQLVANAVKFSDDGSTVAIGCALDGDRLHLWVRDEGVGIAPEQRERIFDRFARAPGEAGRREGAGLGLAIVAAIAEAHGGTVRVDSHPGAGSLFLLDLPAVDVEVDPRPSEEPVASTDEAARA
ncbi:signal transduction histidine kinase [Georgenia soli]|uniref:histidine kinase n=1 Tax=Georgenia soli TaxID=638953 RepID=A0A2A9EQ86_9MICO|nr:sensor histidine kinase [Georgenia soli]PFG40400.1 signal transduction histidine kinase [Georgenia soli]